MSETENKVRVVAEPQLEKDRQRSPAYPSIALDEALAAVTTIYEADHGAPGTMEVIASHLEFSPKSSGFLQSIASMVRFGLMEELEGKPRRLKVSKLAKNLILLPVDHPQRSVGIKTAALSPKPFSDLWTQYGAKLPSDQNLLHQLVVDKQFRQHTAADLIKQYKKTIAFAKLSESDTNKNSEENPPEIGDFIQWVSQGAMQFVVPRRVIGKTDDSEWLFVEESKAGIPIAEATKVSAPAVKDAQMNVPESPVKMPPTQASPPANPNFRAPDAPSGFRQATLPGAAGEIVVRWPMAVSAQEYEIIDRWLEMLKSMIKSSVDTGPAKIEMNPK